jgi:excisionase family DNA binding protein
VATNSEVVMGDAIDIAARHRQEEPRAYRMRQAAALLSLPYSTLYDLVRRGELASVRIGTGARKITLIPRAAIDDLLSRERFDARRGVRK